MSDTLHLFDVVALTHDAPAENLQRGQVGTVVEILAPAVFLVEFSNVDGETYATPELGADDLMRLHYEPSASA